MGVLTGSESRVQSAPLSAESHPGFAKDLEAAIQRSQENLLGMQKPEGYWNGELLVDSTLVSDTVIYHHWNGKVDKA
jgi:squalene-hopene/tetraprenyl-beta-curcumene cyclase